MLLYSGVHNGRAQTMDQVITKPTSYMFCLCIHKQQHLCDNGEAVGESVKILWNPSIHFPHGCDGWLAEGQGELGLEHKHSCPPFFLPSLSPSLIFFSLSML